MGRVAVGGGASSKSGGGWRGAGPWARGPWGGRRAMRWVWPQLAPGPRWWPPARACAPWASAARVGVGRERRPQPRPPTSLQADPAGLRPKGSHGVPKGHLSVPTGGARGRPEDGRAPRYAPARNAQAAFWPFDLHIHANDQASASEGGHSMVANQAAWPGELIEVKGNLSQVSWKIRTTGSSSRQGSWHWERVAIQPANELTNCQLHLLSRRPASATRRAQ